MAHGPLRFDELLDAGWQYGPPGGIGNEQLRVKQHRAQGGPRRRAPFQHIEDLLRSPGNLANHRELVHQPGIGYSPDQSACSSIVGE